MIAIIDYGVGNLFSLESSLRFIGVESSVTNKRKDIEVASHVILPGVGAFADAILKLRGMGLANTIEEQVATKKPLLGICLGMQLLFEKSFEYGSHQGLGLIPGSVEPIEPDIANCQMKLKVPHIGWNRLQFTNRGLGVEKNNNREDGKRVERETTVKHPLLKYSKDGDYVYYVHSYYAKHCEESTLADSEYGIAIPGVVARGCVMGTQFHPEKSGEAGLNILRAFAEL